MGRPRKKNLHLPVGMSLEGGTYYYRKKPAPRITLGRDLEAALTWYARQAVPTRAMRTLGDVITRYRLEVLPMKRSAQTRADQARALDRLAAVFGHMLPDTIAAPMCYRYLDERRTPEGKPAPVAARHEVSLLGHVIGKGIRWGAATVNVVRSLERIKRPKRDRYVSDAEFAACRALASPRMALAMDLARNIGQRRGDLLRLRRDQVGPEGIEIRQGKTGAGVLVEVTPALQATLDALLALPPHIPRDYVLRQEDGQPYTRSGFSSNWQRLMRKYVAAGGKRFTFHDLRAKAASDKPTIAEAQALLGHSSPETTKRVYKRNLTRARPVK
jgi:integrase